MRTIVSFLVFFALVALARGSVCRGRQGYKLTVENRWSQLTDKAFDPRVNSFGYVVAIVHNEFYDAFAVGKPLSASVRHLIQNNNFGPMKKQLEGFRTGLQKRVLHYDYTSTIPRGALSKSYIEFDADVAGNTYLTVIGVLRGTPDSFFGIHRMNLCQNGNWTFEHPANARSEAWVRGYVGGFNARTAGSANFSDIIPEAPVRSVLVESRAGLGSRKHYATFTLKRGRFSEHVDFWEVLRRFYSTLSGEPVA